MKGKIILPITSLLLITSLTGCDQGRTRGDGKVAVKYLISAESISYQTILDEIISDFNALHEEDGYYIETEVPGGDYYTSLGSKFAARIAPDIFMMEYGHFLPYSSYLAPLDTYLANSDKLSSSDLWELNDYYKDNGELKAIIKDFSPDFMLIYNKTMLDNYNSIHPDKQYHLSEDEPVTWEYFYEMTSAIQHSSLAELGTSLGFEGVKHLHEIVQSTGKNVYTNEDKNLNKDDEDVRSAIAFFTALQKTNVSLNGQEKANELSPFISIQETYSDKKAPAAYTSGSTTSEQEMFKQGRCFSIFNGLYSFPSYDFYNINNFEIGIAPHPVQNEGDSMYGTTSAMVSHAIYSKSKYKDYAWEFIEYYQTVGLEKISKIAFNIPGNKTIAGSDNFLNNENEKVKKTANYFYNFVKDGYCYPTMYNSKIDFTSLANCYTSAFTKYFASDSTINFDELINMIDSAVFNKAR